jgi:hypothetical protein
MEAQKNKTEEHVILKAENADKVHISFSEFSLFNQCGHRHLLEKHLGVIQQPPSIHLYFGNAIHSSIEKGLKGNMELNPMIDYFRSTFTKDMMDNMKETADFKNNFYDFLEQGEQILRILQLENIFRDYEIVAIEEALYENLYLKYFFKGFIDLVIRHKVTKRYKIVDWKTSGTDWNVPKKKKDEIFLAQMRFYKFFWGRKNKVALDDIDCGYIVLNRLRDKKDPKSYPGRLQEVDVVATSEEIKISLEKLANTIKMIHIDKKFPKIKHISGVGGCIFCPLKGGRHPLCNSSDKQYKTILKDYKKKQ